MAIPLEAANSHKQSLVVYIYTQQHLKNTWLVQQQI